MAKTKISVDKNAVVARVMHRWDEMLPVLTEEILNDCNQYCKEDTGMLIQSSYFHTDFKRGVMIWQTPYARRQYWAIRTAIPEPNPQATWKWAHVAKAKHAAEWARKAGKLMGVNE